MNAFDNIYYFLVKDLSTEEIVFALIGIGAFVLFAAVFTTKLGKYILPSPKETHLSDFLPFEKLLEDGNTILLKNGSLCRVYKVEGINMIFSSNEIRESYIESKQHLLDTFGELGITGRIITVREKVEEEYYAEHKNPLLGEISEIWAKNMSEVFENSHYIILTVENRENAMDDMNQACSAVEATLHMFKVKLAQERPGIPPELSPFAVFAKIASPITRPHPRTGISMDKDEINSLLTADQIHFTNDKGIIKITSGYRTKYCAVVGIRKPPDYIDEQMLSDMMSLNFEFEVLHNFSPVSKIKALALLINQKKMAIATNFSYQVVDQYDEALATIEESDENYQTLTHYAETFFIYADSKEELHNNILEIEKICRLYGATPVVESWVAEASWFARFPTYDKYPRLYRYLSRAVAFSINFEKMPEGLSKSDWGPGPITIFKTAMGTTYRFQFHVSEADSAVAHTVTIGPTGQGKTTLYAFLAAQAMRHDKLRVFFFDRHRGVEIFTNAISGNYVNFEGDTKDEKAAIEKGGKTVKLNPFRIEDTPENRSFLRRWLKAITMAEDAESEAEIGRAVTTAYDYLLPQERMLKNLYKSCFSSTGHMRKELLRWVDEDQYGSIFNATDDTLDLSNRFTAFDFTYIFEDETLAPAVISYIMNRIQNITGKTGDPSLIIIDETAPMLKHPMFRDNFITGLQEGRKKRQAYLAAFQQPNVIDKLGVGEVIRGQCQTVIFFRNPQARVEDYENWNLSPKEMAFIQGKIYRDLKYAILLSKPSIGESVILNVDISGLGKYLKIFDSGRKNVLLAEELRREHGDNFVKYYLDSFK